MLTMEVARQTEKYTYYSLPVADGAFTSTKHDQLETLLQVMTMHNWTAYYQLDARTKRKIAMSQIEFIQSR